jgi:DHA2 family multidrug resistance protein-like MFS transporter
MSANADRRWWALGAMALSLLVIGLDTTVLNVALPTIAVDLRASNSQLQWFADAYLLVLAALLLPAGMLGDQYGRKRLTVGALAVFGGGSVWCAFSSSPATLITARVVLGIGAAVIIPLAMSAIVVLFEPHERSRAIAVMSAATVLGIPAGPLVGGALLQHFWWGSVFLVNVPVIAVALAAVVVLLPKDGARRREPIDYAGVAMSTVGLVGLTFGLIEEPERGWSNIWVVVSLLAGLAVLVVFVWWESRVRHAEPVMDLALWANHSFRWGVVGATLASFGFFGVLFVLPQYLRSVQGADAFGTGVRTLPLIVGMIVGIQVGMRLARRLGYARITGAGFVVLTGALLLGTRSTSGTGYPLVAIWTSLAGLGFGTALVNAQTASLETLSKERAGAGSAVIQTMRQVGSVIGIASLGAVLNAVYRANVDTSGLPHRLGALVHDNVASGVAVGRVLHSDAVTTSAQHAFVNGMDGVLWLCVAISAVAAVLMWRFLPARRTELENQIGMAGTAQSDLVVSDAVSYRAN